MFRVNVYIDGFNFYYGLKTNGWKKYYWLDVVSFFEKFMNRNQTLENVYYFSAVPTNQGQKDRQDLFFTANKQNPKFHLILGKFIEKRINTKWGVHTTFEEKQTDVNIAVALMRGIINNSCDTSIIVSADSDLIPPIALVKEIKPEHKIYCHFPPNRNSADLTNKADSIIHLGRFEQRFRDSLLPDEIEVSENFTIIKPPSWS